MNKPIKSRKDFCATPAESGSECASLMIMTTGMKGRNSHALWRYDSRTGCYSGLVRLGTRSELETLKLGLKIEADYHMAP